VSVDGLEATASEYAAKLRCDYPGVDRCKAILQERPPRRYERRRFNVRLEIDYAGRCLVINREHDDDPDAALEQAFEAARWTLEAAQFPRRLGC
jgi:hypothetical protein